MLRCEGDILYTGITNDVRRRMDEHFSQGEKSAKFTRSHKAVALAALWITPDRSFASKLEYRIKQLSKSRKLRLIENNSVFADYFGEELSAVTERVDINE